MLTNRSIGRCTVIPELEYADVAAAARWLCDAFGFSLRWEIAPHRALLDVFGDGALMLLERPKPASGSVMVRVADVDAVCARAREHGAEIVREPESFQYGERQCNVRDLGGHTWTFSQSIADVAPEEWGAVTKLSR